MGQRNESLNIIWIQPGTCILLEFLKISSQSKRRERKKREDRIKGWTNREVTGIPKKLLYFSMSKRQLKKTPHNYLTSKLVHSKWNFWIHGPNLIFPVSLWLRKWHLHMVNCLSQKFRNCSLFLSFCQSHVESISKVSWLYLQNILPPSSFTTILIITTLGPSIITHLHALPNFATFPCHLSSSLHT